MLSFFDFLGRAVCHQSLERSFLIGGKPLMVCSRCSGFYLSFFLSFFILWLLKRELTYKRDFLLALALIFPLALDGTLSYLGWWQTNNYLRWATGVMAGFSFALLLLPLFVRDSNAQKSLTNYLLDRFKVFFIVLALVSAVSFFNGFYLENLLIALGIFLLFLVINFAWLEFVFRNRKRKMAAFFLAIVLTVGELAVLSHLHFFKFSKV